MPRALFAADDTMLHCLSKIRLMTVLKKLPTDKQRAAFADVQIVESGGPATRKVAAVIDGMAEIQCLKKPDWVKNY